MSKMTFAWLGLALLLVLAGALSLRAVAARSEPWATGMPGRLVLPLPDGGGVAPATERPSSATLQLLQADSSIAYGFTNDWHAGDQLGVALQASSLQHPLTIQSIDCYLTRFISSTEMVQLRGHVYALSDGRPGALLGSSAPYTVTLPANHAQWVNLPLASVIRLDSPQPFLVAVEYVGGTQGETPSVINDISTDIPHGSCYYQADPGVWTEHYALWARPSEVGYSIIRAWVNTSGGPGDETVVEPLADAFLASEQARRSFGVQEYLLVGDYGSGLGDTRALLRFPLPQAPIAGATPIAATVRLFRYSEVTRTLPLTLTAYRTTGAWDEASATWYTHSMRYAEAYGSGQVPAQHPYPEPTRSYLLRVDVAGLVQSWLRGEPNEGLMLIGGEDTPSSAKRFYARELATASEKRPRLIVKWALPAPTGTGSPTVTPTPSITPTPGPGGPTLTPTSSPTVTCTPEEPTRTPTSSITPGEPTSTPTHGPVKALFLPLLRKR
jgi:hypothetical protein